MGCAGAAMVVESPESVVKEEKCEVAEEKSRFLSDVRSSSEEAEKPALASLPDHLTLRVYLAIAARGSR